MQLLRNSSARFIILPVILLFILNFLKISSGSCAEDKSSEVPSSVRPAVPCGVLEAFTGDVQILDANRTHLITATSRANLPCGSWVSVNQGWAEIRHQNGPRIHLAKQSFVQLPDFRTDPLFKGDHIVLYRGEIYAEVGDGEEEFRIVSSIGRARLKNTKVILLLNQAHEETQLIALQNSATLENRFETNRKVKIQAGEETSLNFKLLRVIPALPSAISVSSLKPKLNELGVPENDRIEAIRAVLRRQGRTFPEHPRDLPVDDAEPEEKDDPSRKPAKEKTGSYLRHMPEKEDQMLHSYWVTKMAGGQQVGEKILYPDKFYGKSQRIRVEVLDPAEKLNKKLQKQEEVEKKHLMEELSQIRVE